MSTWNEWSEKEGIDLKELCKCGHSRFSHNGTKKLGVCNHEDWTPGNISHCICVRFRKGDE